MEYILTPISRSTFEYLGCSNNPYLRSSIDGIGNEVYFWHGPAGQMYRPLPGRRPTAVPPLSDKEKD